MDSPRSPHRPRAPRGSYFAALSPRERAALPPALLATVAAFAACEDAVHCATQAGAFSNCAAMAAQFLLFARERGHEAEIVLLKSAPFDDSARLWETSDPRLAAVHPYYWHHYVTRLDGRWLVDWTARQFDPGAPHPVIFPSDGIAVGVRWRAASIVIPATALLPDTVTQTLVPLTNDPNDRNAARARPPRHRRC